MASATRKRRIVILGGGPGGMAAAYGLTQRPDWRDEYEITVYQLGWRLGGKGASGRRASDHQRIEEHGLHIWGGYYWNAFRLIRACYEEYGKMLPANAPIRSVEQAFLPLTQFTWMENIEGDWRRWNVEFPFSHQRPWDLDGVPQSLWDSFAQTLEWMLSKVGQIVVPTEQDIKGVVKRVAGWIHHAVGVVEHDFEMLWEWVVSRFSSHGAGGSVPSTNPSARDLLSHSLHAARNASEPPRRGEESHGFLSGTIGMFKAWLAEIETSVWENDALRRLWIVLDLGATILLGVLRDDLLHAGLNAINDVEFRDWLISNGVSKSVLESPAVTSVYDYAFAYENGDGDRPSLAAGTVIEILHRSCFHYRGAISWRMMAGMGDTIFSPIYRVLKERGVTFRFFHRVRSLGLSSDGQSIGSIELGRQVTLKDPSGEYDPLVTVLGVESWPSTPRYEQILDAEANDLLAQKIDLESAWSPWNNTRESPVLLREGEDFDTVVLAISLGAFRDVCQHLLKASPAWASMVEKVKTVQTQAVQLWLDRDAAQLGWDYKLPLAIGYAESLDTYADQSHLLPREAWGDNAPPRSIAYFCDTLKDAETIPPYTDHAFPQRELDRVGREAIQWFEANSVPILASAEHPPGDPANYIWTIIHDPDVPAGPGRFASQYHRANINPTDRYVLSVPGSFRYRMKADGSGFRNLFLAGDWVTTQINAGCVEAAVTAGLLASQAICGYPTEIIEPY